MAKERPDQSITPLRATTRWRRRGRDYSRDYSHSHSQLSPYDYATLDQYWKERRGRGIGHIINLAADAFLFGTDVDAFTEKTCGIRNGEMACGNATMQRAQEMWRTQGAIGKLHNLARTIRVGPQMSEYFKAITIGNNDINRLQPLQDNDTRLLSHDSSIERAFLIKQRLQTFSIIYQKDYKLEPLTPEDWEILEELLDVLQSFFAAIKDLQSHATEGHHGSIWEWIPAIVYLRIFTKKLEEFGAKCGKKHPMTVAMQNAWQKLNIYWRLSDKAEAMYAAATLLSLCGRKAYFERKWPHAEMDSMIKTVHEYFLEFYANRQGTFDTPVPVTAKPTPREIMLSRGGLIQRNTHSDSFLNYIHQQPEGSEVDVLNWWLQYGPIELRQMALDILSIPAMSAEVEPDRNALTIESLEIFELLRNWWRGDVILQRKDDGDARRDRVRRGGERQRGRKR